MSTVTAHALPPSRRDDVMLKVTPHMAVDMTVDEAEALIVSLRLAVQRASMRACHHPLSCTTCNRLGEPCGQHRVGDSAHRNCSGTRH